MKLESTFEKARILMRWGALGMPICLLLAFIAVAACEATAAVSLQAMCARLRAI